LGENKNVIYKSRGCIYKKRCVQILENCWIFGTEIMYISCKIQYEECREGKKNLKNCKELKEMS
jgi:hypothetical protein